MKTSILHYIYILITWHSGCSSVSRLSLFSLKYHWKRVNIPVLFPQRIIRYDILYILFHRAIQFHRSLRVLRIGQAVHHIQHLREGLPGQKRPQVLVNLKHLWFHHICMVLCYIPKNIRKYIEWTKDANCTYLLLNFQCKRLQRQKQKKYWLSLQQQKDLLYTIIRDMIDEISALC